jgi:hypothetical protein
MDESGLSVDELRQHWHLELVLAYVRGTLPNLTEGDPHQLLSAGRGSGLDLDPFKRSSEAARFPGSERRWR